MDRFWTAARCASARQVRAIVLRTRPRVLEQVMLHTCDVSWSPSSCIQSSRTDDLLLDDPIPGCDNYRGPSRPYTRDTRRDGRQDDSNEIELCRQASWDPRSGLHWVRGGSSPESSGESKDVVVVIVVTAWELHLEILPSARPRENLPRVRVRECDLTLTRLTYGYTHGEEGTA